MYCECGRLPWKKPSSLVIDLKSSFSPTFRSTRCKISSSNNCNFFYGLYLHVYTWVPSIARCFIIDFLSSRVVVQKCSVKLVFLQILQNSQERTFDKAAPAQWFCCKFCEIFKKIFFIEHLRATAFVSFRSKCSISFINSLSLSSLWIF